MRINSAKDDAAGLQIADRLTSQINGLNQGNRNASDAIAFAQTAEGAMDEISNMLQKIRTLAVQASTGTLTTTDREAIKKESDALIDEISRIAQQTTYGGKKILEGSDNDADKVNTMYGVAADPANASKGGQLTIQVGANSGDTITFDVGNFIFSALASAAGANPNPTANKAFVACRAGVANKLAFDLDGELPTTYRGGGFRLHCNTTTRSCLQWGLSSYVKHNGRIH